MYCTYVVPIPLIIDYLSGLQPQCFVHRTYLQAIVFRSPVGNWYKDWQLDWTTTDHNWTAVASCNQLRSVQLPVAQFAKNQKDWLWTGHLAHDPPIQGHIPNFFHIFIYLFEFTRVLSIMVTPKMTYNAKSVISWAPVDRIL